MTAFSLHCVCIPARVLHHRTCRVPSLQRPAMVLTDARRRHGWRQLGLRRLLQPLLLRTLQCRGCKVSIRYRAVIHNPKIVGSRPSLIGSTTTTLLLLRYLKVLLGDWTAIHHPEIDRVRMSLTVLVLALPSWRWWGVGLPRRSQVANDYGAGAVVVVLVVLVVLVVRGTQQAN